MDLSSLKDVMTVKQMEAFKESLDTTGRQMLDNLVNTNDNDNILRFQGATRILNMMIASIDEAIKGD